MLPCANFLVLFHSQNSMKYDCSICKNMQVDAEYNSTRTLFAILMIPYHFVSIHHTDHFILKTSRKGTDEYTIIFLHSLALIKLLRAFWKLLWLLNELGVGGK